MNSRILIVGFFSMIFFSCGRNNADYVDERHRPNNWESTIDLKLIRDTTQPDVERLKVFSFTSSEKIEVLVDQVYDVAFSGDADIRLPNFLGDVGDNSVSPEELLDELQQFDTSTVQDLFSGEMKDTVVDISFRKSTVSLLHLSFNASKPSDEGIVIQPEAIGLGSVQYDEDLSLKGFRIRFYEVLNGSDSFESAHQMVFTTDSLGIFRPFEINTYNPILGQTFAEKLKLSGDTMEVKLLMKFDYIKQNLLIEVLNESREVI